jgi:hypothetical protein
MDLSRKKPLLRFMIVPIKNKMTDQKTSKYFPYSDECALTGVASRKRVLLQLACQLG